LCELRPERGRWDEVRERTLPVDLDHGQQLPITGLQVGFAADVHLLELEAELLAGRVEDALRGRTEVAALGVEEDDPGYG
jgi:hypothetical protein